MARRGSGDYKVEGAYKDLSYAALPLESCLASSRCNMFKLLTLLIGGDRIASAGVKRMNRIFFYRTRYFCLRLDCTQFLRTTTPGDQTLRILASTTSPVAQSGCSSPVCEAAGRRKSSGICHSHAHVQTFVHCTDSTFNTVGGGLTRSSGMPSSYRTS